MAILKKIKLFIAVMAILAVSSSVASVASVANGPELTPNWAGCEVGTQ